MNPVIQGIEKSETLMLQSNLTCDCEICVKVDEKGVDGFLCVCKQGFWSQNLKCSKCDRKYSPKQFQLNETQTLNI